MINPINGLEMANQSGIASRKGSEWCLNKRQGARFFVLVLGIFSMFWCTLTRRGIDPCSAKRVRAIQQGGIRKIRTSDSRR